MPSTVQIVVSMQNANNYVTESLNDSFTTQYGRHSTGAIPTANAYYSFAWPTSGETMVYMKFPQFGAVYQVRIIRDISTPTPAVFNIPPGSTFVPVMIPQPLAAADGTIYYAIQSTVVLPTLPMFYF